MSHASETELNCAVDHEAFVEVIEANLSPDGVAVIVAFLREKIYAREVSPRTLDALKEAEWLADTLTGMLSPDRHNELMQELGLL